MAGTLLLLGPELPEKPDELPPLDVPTLELAVRLEDPPWTELETSDVDEETRPDEDTGGRLLLVTPLLLLVPGLLLLVPTDDDARLEDVVALLPWDTT